MPGRMAWSEHLLGLACLLSVLAGSLCKETPVEDVHIPIHQEYLQNLFDLVAAEQTKEDIPLKLPFQLYRHKGVFSSAVKLYFHGAPEFAEARRLMDVFDNNMFVTAWVTSSLLEAYRLGDAPKPSEEMVINALNSFQVHQDKNRPYANSAMTFWPQVYNATSKYYESAPTNLLACFDLASDLPLNLTEDILKLIGLEGMAKYLDQIVKNKIYYLQAFHIPPDFDDTFVNLGLGSLLFGMKDEFPESWAFWNKMNSNVTSVFDDLKKYAYRPFSKDNMVNGIDPRTYYYMRHFLDQANAEGKDLALVTTWIQNVEELRTEFYKGVGMPFQANNVDVTVCANTIYGITSAILSGLVSPKYLEDPDIAQIYVNTSTLIAYEMNNNISSRPDLALLYYPSRIEFNWFVTRTVALMDEAVKKGPLPAKVMNTVYSILTNATHRAMTDYILSQAKPSALETFYFDDFLGDGDLTPDGRPLQRGEDRIFTTSMALNALLYTWTQYDASTKTSTWKSDTPAKVKQMIDGAARWVYNHATDGNFDPWNAFFSGSVKGIGTYPLLYPANSFELLNGTVIPDTAANEFRGDVITARGHIDPQKYAEMMKKKHFGMVTPTVFNGYNTVDGFFPLWSSVPYTYSTALLGLARYNQLQD